MKLFYILYFFVFYAYKVVESGFAVSFQILKGSRGADGILIEYHPVVKKSWQVVLLFNLISMTPGSMSVDIKREDNTILVHLLNRKDRSQFMAATGKLERLLLKTM
ncbi:Na+/H+ antiporter subunit E [Thermophagus sp. OGC60D27]|uniref:Na+/H+ antiporter subunit E n=1 Tax=Thermophagus sp. OGC60D27 TaxID=3458415 RepID=UPI004037AFB4